MKLSRLQSDTSLNLVLLPGTGCDQQLWEKILPSFPSHINLIFPDLGGGKSIDEMVSIVEQLPYKNFALLGFSMGGYLAQVFFQRFPERVSHLILISASRRGYPERQKVRTQNLINQIENRIIDPTSISYLSRFVDLRSAESTQAFQTIEAMLRRIGIQGLTHQMKATFDRKRLLAKPVKVSLACLLIGGRFDLVVPPSHLEELSRTFNTPVEWVNTGHMAPLEDPSSVGSLLNRFFQNGDQSGKRA